MSESKYYFLCSISTVGQILTVVLLRGLEERYFLQTSAHFKTDCRYVYLHNMHAFHWSLLQHYACQEINLEWSIGLNNYMWGMVILIKIWLLLLPLKNRSAVSLPLWELDVFFFSIRIVLSYSKTMQANKLIRILPRFSIENSMNQISCITLDHGYICVHAPWIVWCAFFCYLLQYFAINLD